MLKISSAANDDRSSQFLDLSIDLSSSQKIALPFSRSRDCGPCDASSSSGLRHRAFADHELKAQIDDRFRRPAAFDRVDYHGDRVPSHLVAVGAHAGERGDGGGHEFQVIEADNSHFSGNRDLAALTLEQYTERKVVIDAEYRVDIRLPGHEIGKQRAAKRNRGRYGGRNNEVGVEQRGPLHGVAVTF